MSISSSVSRGQFWRRDRFMGQAANAQVPSARVLPEPSPGKRAADSVCTRLPATSEQTTTMSVLLSNRGAIAFAGKAHGAITATTEPGYDAGQQLHAGEVDIFAKSATFSWPAGSDAPSGDDNTDPEVATPGHL